jgi:hypothetical protein
MGNSALETTGNIGVEKRFEDGRTAAGVNFFLTRYDSNSLGSGPNLFGGAQIQVRRQLTRNTQLRISYRFWDNQGDYKIDDMQQNRLLVELNLHY